jgi:uncharacterized protein YbjT (DUF2867 family)
LGENGVTAEKEARMTRKIIAVVGATGAQGGGLARTILDDPEGGFAVRAITRDPNSDKAQALAARGAEVVQADLDDPASLKAAFQGAYGVFCLTNFWEHFDPAKETAQGRNLAQAAAAAEVQHAIWSTFEDTRDFIPLSDDRMPTLQERYKVPHFDAKADADPFFRETGVPTTFLRTSGYFENFIHFGWGPQRQEDGSLAVVFPMDDKKLPLIAVADIGKCAYSIFQRGDEYRGRTLGIAGEHLTGDEIAAGLSDALGTPVGYVAVPPEVFRSFGFPGADDVGNMFQFKRDFNEMYTETRDLDECRRLNPELQDLKAWLKENGDKVPVP